MKNQIFILVVLFMFNACSSSQNSPKQKDTLELNNMRSSLVHLRSSLLRINAICGKKWSDLSLSSSMIQSLFENRPKFKRQVIELKKKTIALVRILDKLEGALEKTAGHGINPHTHSIMTPLEVKEVERYMITEKQAYHLEKSLNDYVRFLNNAYKPYSIPRLPLIAAGNAKNPLYEHQPAKQKLDFAHAYFAQTTAIMALSYLTHFQNIVLRYEEEVMKYMILSLVD